MDPVVVPPGIRAALSSLRRLLCRGCQSATADHAQIIALARAVTVAWFERHRRGLVCYDAHLGSAESTRLWVSTNQAPLRTK